MLKIQLTLERTRICTHIDTVVIIPRLLSRESYSWQEYIEYSECKSSTDVQNFFRCVGLYLAVFYMLSSTDIHYENMISAGSAPVFIDLESIVHGKVSKHEQNNFKNINDSVLASGMLPGSLSAEGVIDVNISALFTGNDKSGKYRSFQILEDDELDWVYVSQEAVVQSKQNAVKLNGKDIEPEEVEDIIVTSFRNAMYSIIDNRKDFLSLLSKKSNENISIRKVLRPTLVYSKFLLAISHPQCMRSTAIQDDLDTEIVADIVNPATSEILECRGCLNCFQTGNCSIGDDMSNLRQKLYESDIIIFASPVYLGTVSGATKTFLDRIAYWSHLFYLTGRLGYCISVSDNNGNKDTNEFLHNIMRYYGLSVIGDISFNTSQFLNKEAYNSIIRYEAKKVQNLISSHQYPIDISQNAYYQTCKEKIEATANKSFESEHWRQSGFLLHNTFIECFEANLSPGLKNEVCL